MSLVLIVHLFTQNTRNPMVAPVTPHLPSLPPAVPITPCINRSPNVTTLQLYTPVHLHPLLPSAIFPTTCINHSPLSINHYPSSLDPSFPNFFIQFCEHLLVLGYNSYPAPHRLLNTKRRLFMGGLYPSLHGTHLA